MADRLSRILALVKMEIEKQGTEAALRLLTSEGYLSWCEDKELTLGDIKQEIIDNY